MYWKFEKIHVGRLLIQSLDSRPLLLWVSVNWTVTGAQCSMLIPSHTHFDIGCSRKRRVTHGSTHPFLSTVHSSAKLRETFFKTKYISANPFENCSIQTVPILPDWPPGWRPRFGLAPPTSRLLGLARELATKISLSQKNAFPTLSFSDTSHLHNSGAHIWSIWRWIFGWGRVRSGGRGKMQHCHFHQCCPFPFQLLKPTPTKAGAVFPMGIVFLKIQTNLIFDTYLSVN